MGDEYIKRGDVLIKLEIAYDMARLDQKLPISDLQHEVNLIKAADVQPIDRWISVDDALPIYDGLVLICYNDKRIRLGVYTEDGWYSDEGNPIMEQTDFWVRIPEPPNQ